MQKVLSTAHLFGKAFPPLVLLVLSAAFSVKAAQAQQDDLTTTQARPSVTSPDQPTTNKKNNLFITFIKTHPSGAPAATSSASPDATSLGCNVGYPQVGQTYEPPSANWTASVSCSADTGLYGTTVLYTPSNNQVITDGSQINTFGTEATSSGSYSLQHGLSYDVNFNITITPPAGYTTTAGTNCKLSNNNTSVTCTVTTGPFSTPAS